MRAIKGTLRLVMVQGVVSVLIGGYTIRLIV